MDNKRIADVYLNKIRELGFKPYDIEYGNGYFLFEMGENSVVHFRLKGVSRHWKFGMWIRHEELSAWYRYLYEKKYNECNWKPVSIFCQYDTQIDKFKPSASDLCVEFDVEDVIDDVVKNENSFQTIILERMLYMIKKHPLICYAGYCGEHYVGYFDKSFLKHFLKYEGMYYKETFKLNLYKLILYPYTKIKIFFAKHNKIVKDIIFEDFEKENEGWSTSYKYSVTPIFTKDATDDEIDKWYHKWFKKKKYGKYSYFEYVVEVMRNFYIENDDCLYGLEEE